MLARTGLIYSILASVRGMSPVSAVGLALIRPVLRSDTEQQQCLVVLLHAVPFDFAHD
jgi:hypothetical protein